MSLKPVTVTKPGEVVRKLNDPPVDSDSEESVGIEEYESSGDEEEVVVEEDEEAFVEFQVALQKIADSVNKGKDSSSEEEEDDEEEEEEEDEEDEEAEDSDDD